MAEEKITTPMDAIGSGKEAANEQPTEVEWSKDGGTVTRRKWKGGPQAIFDLFSEIRAAGEAERAKAVVGKTGMLEATYPSQEEDGDDDNEDENATWELHPTEIQAPLSTHFLFTPESLGGDAGEDIAIAIARIESELSNPDINIADVPYEDMFSDKDVTNADLYRDFRAKGIEKYTAFTCRVREVKVISGRSQVEAAMDNIGLIDDPPTPNQAAKFALDALGFEYVKTMPAVVQHGRFKLKITTEWWGIPNWDDTLYGGEGAA